MAESPMPGRGLVTRRAVGDVVRRAALGSYGVVAVSGPRPWHSALAWIGRATPGVRVRLGPPLTVDLYISVARGVPVAEVARNVDSAVRYRVRQALGREIDELAVHVDRLRTPVSPSTDAGNAPDGSQQLDREPRATTTDAEAPSVEAGPGAA
ncbi:MAG TPA: Asp23/Gls24 family envelope stress response protein [Candidatus Limnocylindrales bacterium]|jgi:uncharacterized alkaline shock family protein YloU